jgi:hypothetical protein|nr:hypothetical protein [Kofleriaceae bacterium]
MTRKLARDPYLRALVAARGEQAAWDSGYFDDGDDGDAPLDDIDWACTPLPPADAAATARRPAVLLATGGFCPPHAGHLEMMERARDAATTQLGFDVIAGYLSPGHDRYARMKAGDAAMPAPARLAACAELAARSGADWLVVDPWEALHRRVAVNFTDVCARLRAYLRAHVDLRVEVVYVCGGDNARFALAFAEDGACVVVARPGSDATVGAWRARLAGHPRIAWADGDHPGASRALRPPGAWRAPRSRVVVRLEDARAVRTLGLPADTWCAFQRELVALLRAHAEVRVVEAAPGARAEPGELVVDPMVDVAGVAGAHALAISRAYALGGYHARGHVARPGSPPLDAQLAAIPPGDYVLRDDDRATGGTFAAARALLPAHARVADVERVAIAHDADEDVVDSRDFLLGSDDGGLVVELPARRLGRAPYVLPYVDPAARCSLPPTAVRAISIAVWELAARTLGDRRLSALPAPARATLEAMGLAGDPPRTLGELCRWHATRLAGDGRD